MKKRTPSASVRPAHVSPGGLWFAPETVAAMEAMRAKSQSKAPSPALTLEEFCQRHFPQVLAQWRQTGVQAPAAQTNPAPNQPQPKPKPKRGLWFAPQATNDINSAAVKGSSTTNNANEAKSITPRHLRQPQHAWEMTLEEFRQTYFPELCAKPNEAESTSQREAA